MRTIVRICPQERNDAKGFPASALARENAGDWRNRDQIEGWATEIGRVLDTSAEAA